MKAESGRNPFVKSLQLLVKERVFQFAVILSLVNFLIAASLGVFIRLVPFLEFSINTRYIIHAHSHVAFLGWVFLGLMALIFDRHLFGCRRVLQWFLIYISIIQFSIFGMLATFPFTGYALWSIVFSSIHMIASIVFIFYFKRESLPINSPAKSFIWMALIFMALSSIGPLALGPLSVMGHKSGFYYDMAIYFYLHFQYNGWFTLAIIGLLLNLIDKENLLIFSGKIKTSLLLLCIGIGASYLLSALGYRPGLSFNIIGGVGALFQMAGFYLLTPILFHAIKKIENRFLKQCLIFATIALGLKMLAQLGTAFPIIVDFTYFNRDWVIAFLHWVLLGFVSVALLGLLMNKMFGPSLSPILKTGSVLFIIAFLLTELVLVFKEKIISIREVQIALVLFPGLAILMLLGVGLIFFATYLKILSDKTE